MPAILRRVMRPSGTAFIASAYASSRVPGIASSPCQAMSVSTQPGQIAFTCTSRGAARPRASGRDRAGRPSTRSSRCSRDGDPREDRGHDDEPSAVDEVPLDRAHAAVRPDEVHGDELVEAVARPGSFGPPMPLHATSAKMRPVRPRRRRTRCRPRRGRGCRSSRRARRRLARRPRPAARARGEQGQPRAVAGEPERDRAADSRSAPVTTTCRPSSGR